MFINKKANNISEKVAVKWSLLGQIFLHLLSLHLLQHITAKVCDNIEYSIQPVRLMTMPSKNTKHT